MTINAKTLVKDKFWIIEENGQKLGTLQKQDNNGWIFLSNTILCSMCKNSCQFTLKLLNPRVCFVQVIT